MRHKKLTNLVLTFGFAFCFSALAAYGLYAEEGNTASTGLIDKAWAAHGRGDLGSTFKYTNECIRLYKDEADKEESALKALPKNKDEIKAVQALNDVATAYFIQAEAYMRQNKLDEAKRLFKLVIDKYPFAQAWDQRGWFWQVADISKLSIKKIETGNIEAAPKKRVSQVPTKLVLYDPGKEDFINYEKYGEFQNVGTKDYKYIIKDQEGLSIAAGEGVYPNTTSVRRDPEFKKALKEKRLEGSQWDFLQSPDLEAAFLKWATSSEPQGVKLYYTGLILEKAGYIKQALKCYYAILVNFPGSYGWTYWHTPWYVGQAAEAKIKFILRHNPQLGYRLEGADIRIINGYENDVSNNIVIANPGKFVKAGTLHKLRPRPPAGHLAIKRYLGKGKVHLVQYETGDWQLIVDGKPYIIRGISYAPTKIGESPDEGTMTNWMTDDFNYNGKIDGPYDAFVDDNKNNIQDEDELAVGDFKLMKDMGVNTIRLYHQPFDVKKEVLGDLYKNYGIRVIMGDFLGKYTLGSGAPWNPGTDYNNEQQKKNMMDSAIKMVTEFKDEPYILFWLLGNENVYGYACNANTSPDAFFRFVNEVAKKIKEIDPDHPVAIGNGDVLYLDKFGRDCPDVDIFGANAYRGDYGFGSFWEDVKQEADKPAVITEFGCPAYAEGRSLQEAEGLQAEYLKDSWEDIEGNMAFADGQGNALGGVVFEWLDEWWKAYEPFIHDTKSLWPGPFPDGYMHEEWLGLCSQGDGKLSPFLRQLRSSYFMFKKMWR